MDDNGHYHISHYPCPHLHERLYLLRLRDNFAWLSVCQCLCACYRLETGCCIDEAGLPIHYYRLGSTTPCHIPPLLTCATLNQPSQSPRSATGGKLYTCTLDTEKNCIQAPGHSRLLSILTHTSGPGPGTVEGREGDMGHDNSELGRKTECGSVFLPLDWGQKMQR